MSERSLLSVLALSLTFALACSGGAPTSTSTTAPPPPPPPVVATPAGMTGVPECDDYIKKMEACLATMDATTRSAMEASFKASKDAWIQAATTEAGKTSIAQACSAAASVAMTGCGAAATTTTTTTTGTASTTADGKSTGAATTTTTTTADGKTTETVKTETTATETKAAEPAERVRRPSGSGGVERSGSGSSGSSDGSSGERKGGVKR